MWKEGTKIASYHHQVSLRADLRGLLRSIAFKWNLRKELQEELTNIILDYWGTMGPDCCFMQGGALRNCENKPRASLTAKSSARVIS